MTHPNERTVQGWEQRRRAPAEVARTLLMIAAKNPAGAAGGGVIYLNRAE
jgi:DNA-binding transcriptional regulator YiaG